MESARSLILIDHDSRRRAGISHALSGSQLHVEPFEDAAELGDRWPRSGMVLIHDEGDAVPVIMQAMIRAGRWLPVVAFAEDPAPGRIVEAILKGTVDYLVWPFEPEVLVATLERAEERAAAIGSARMRQAAARNRIERLTRREREVLAGVASGLSNRMIGEKLSISPRTVEIHRSNMLNKMGAHHSSEAIRIAIEASLVDDT